MTKNSIQKIFNAVLFLGLFMICLFLIKYSKINASYVSDNSFLFNYLGIVLGFALTIFTFIVSMVDKIKDGIENDNSKTDEQKKSAQNNILQIYSELKDNIYLIFVFFIVVSLFALFDRVDIPFVSIGEKFIVNKQQIINAVKLEIFGLSLYAIYDLCSSSFKISETSGVFRNKKKAT